ncbi:acyl-CoA carboxylase subunit beta [Anaerotalea alkaliphila]|uniref:Carboxyl transferase n=1 Tax=Anaerotalea alkaliphila TaxID=2662126 RepID=A0A7X5HTU4_9FIRM|nr:carboxyl transferase domain-containing protein [Anaerotalea alkaliphila]NDL66296.1 carboxyl transferase [Anaerotalea alkaliphila]
MSIQQRKNDLTNRRAHIELGGGKDAIGKLHAKGKLTARERISRLLDENSFVEVGAFVTSRVKDFDLGSKNPPADGVVTGFGTVRGRLVYVYSQDATVLGGALGEMHGKKIGALYDMALKMGAPVVGFLDSAGLRLQETSYGLEGFGAIYQKQSQASGVLPQITAVMGNCGGGSAVITSLSDFTFMTEKNAHLFVNSPNTLDDRHATMDKYASAKFHGETTGIVDFVCKDEAGLIEDMVRLLDMLPSNNREEAYSGSTTDDLNREDWEIVDLVGEGMDGRQMAAMIADNHQVVEVKALYGQEVVTAFVKMNGNTVGLVGSQSAGGAGRIGRDGCDKIADFVRFCDAFNIPLVTLVDVEGFEATVEQEQKAVSKAIADMTAAFVGASVPKVDVLVHRAYGSAYVSLNSKHVGADIVLAWPSATMSVMDPKAAVRIMYAEELAASKDARALQEEKAAEYAKQQASPYAAAERGFVDDIIEPQATRKHVIYTLEMLRTKRAEGLDKKHNTI